MPQSKQAVSVTRVLNTTEAHTPLAGDRAATLLESHSFPVLALIVATAAFGAWAGGHLKQLWYDEIFSVIVARTTNWTDMKVAMSADANPPLFALLVKACLHLFGSSEFSIRLPSLLGFLGALVGTFVFVRRETKGLFALFATTLVLAEPGWTYAFEARPYALLLGLMMLGLVSWQTATKTKANRPFGLLGIWVALVLSMLSHGLGLVQTGLPLVFAEAARFRKTRKIDWPVWLAGIASLPVLLFTYPISRRANNLLFPGPRAALTRARFMAIWVHQPLGSVFLIVSASLILLLITVLVLYAKSPAIKLAFSEPAIWAAVGATLLIPVTYLIMTSASGYYNCRYGIGSTAGIAMLFSLLYARATRISRPLLVLFMIGILGHFTASAAHLALRKSPDRPTVLETTKPVSLPFVVANPFTMMPHWYYATRSERNRLVFLRDQPDEHQQHHSVVDICIATVATITDLNVAEFSEFLANHPEFIFEDDGTPPAKATHDLLTARGYVLTVMSQDESKLFLAIRSTSPSGTAAPSSR